MRTLGIDPGTGRMGWAILDREKGKESLMAYGCFETRKHNPLPETLGLIYEEIERLVKKYKPDEAAVEDLFFATNAKTAMAVGQARGAVLVALTNNKIPVYSYTPLQIKSGVTGYGQADKQQVQKMVKVILKLKEVPKPDDAADAVAVALTHGALGRMVG